MSNQLQVTYVRNCKSIFANRYTMGNIKIEKVVFKIHSTIHEEYINIKEKKIKISRWQMCKFIIHVRYYFV
jgi:hypothetical protein